MAAKQKFERSIRILYSAAPEACSWFRQLGKEKGQVLRKALISYRKNQGNDGTTTYSSSDFRGSPDDYRMTFRLYYPYDVDLIEWIQTIDGDEWNVVITFAVLDYYCKNHTCTTPELRITTTMEEALTEAEAPVGNSELVDGDKTVCVSEEFLNISQNLVKNEEDISKQEYVTYFLSDEEKRILLRIIYYT